MCIICESHKKYSSNEFNDDDNQRYQHEFRLTEITNPDSIWYRLKWTIWKLRYQSGLTDNASQNIDDWSALASLNPVCQRQAVHTDADPDMVV